MRARGILAFVICLLGATCTPAPQSLPPRDLQAVSAALSGWRQAGLPSPEEGRCDFSRVYVKSVGECPGAYSAVGYAACLSWNESANWFFTKRYPVINLMPGIIVDNFGEPLIHELMHAFYDCSGYASPLGYHVGNIQHLEPRVWTAAESSAQSGTSAQSRARKLMQ